MFCGAFFLGGEGGMGLVVEFCVLGGLLVGGFCVPVGYGLLGLLVGGVLGWVSRIVWAF